ncbi:TPA: restriction endonuclease subunit S [Enterococcus faecalis]
MKYNEVLLSKFDVEIIDGDRGKNYPSKIEFSSDGHTLFLNNKNVISNKLDTSFGDYISKERSNLLRKGKLERGDIVLTTRGSIGNVGFYSNNIIQEHIRINSGMVIIRNHDSRIFTPFLYLLLRSDYAKEQYEKLSSGSVQKQLPIRDLKFFNVLDVPFYKQNKIWNIINAFDSKIELNNQIISNLEELASTLFKRWFVDFEFPDENGNPYKSSGGKMVDSELGEIPEGWKVTNLEEISIDIITGKTPNTKQKENYGEDIPFIKIPDMHNNTYIVQTETYLSKKGSDSQYKKLLPKDSICVSCIATPGLVSITSVASHTNQQINTILPKVEDLYFLYLDLKRKKNLIRELGSGGSTTLNLNKTQFGKINIVNCGKREKMNFNKICEPLFSKILLLQKSNIYLAKLRDLLLPKLLSGEIELPEDEEM